MTRLLVGLLLIAFWIGVVSLLAGCACEPKIIEKVVYKTPVLPDLKPTQPPSFKPYVWGDYPKYKALCLSKINECNADKKAIKDAINE